MQLMNVQLHRPWLRMAFDAIGSVLLKAPVQGMQLLGTVMSLVVLFLASHRIYQNE